MKAGVESLMHYKSLCRGLRDDPLQRVGKAGGIQPVEQQLTHAQPQLVGVVLPAKAAAYSPGQKKEHIEGKAARFRAGLQRVLIHKLLGLSACLHVPGHCGQQHLPLVVRLGLRRRTPAGAKAERQQQRHDK